MYHKTQLPNGLRIMVINLPHMESVSLGIWIGTGGRYENKQNSGISHCLEHMVFKGTRSRSTRDIKESIEGIGGSLNGFTDEEATCYLVKVPKKHIEQGLDVLSDMVLHPKVTKADLDLERGVIFEEIKIYKDRPDQYVHQLLCETLWPDHQLGMSLVGTEETLKKMDRARILDYKDRTYSPENIVVCVCGNVDEEAFVEAAKARLSKMEKKPLGRFKKFQSKQKKPRFRFYYKETEQTHVDMGFHNVSRFHPDKYTSSLLHILLGGNMSSRLFHEVREVRGLAYEISSGVKCYSDTGAFYVTAGVDNKKLPRALEVIMKELRKIKAGCVTEDEFKRAKDFFRGQISMTLEDTMARMIWVGEKLIVNDINYNIDEVIDSIDSVTREMVRDLAKKIFRTANMNVAMIGPLSKKDQASIKKRMKL